MLGRRRLSRWIVWLAVCLLLVIVSGTAFADAPDQLTRGAEMFKIRCQPCHGDVGQGLALWRLTWAPEDQYCASHKCHGLGHPPDGFYMPNDAPALIGKDALTHFATARELYGYTSKAMPFDKPGELSSDDYWAVTAFLLRENGKLPDSILLNTSNAASVIINPDAQTTPTLSDATQVPSPSIETFAVAAGIALIAILALASFIYRRRAAPKIH